MRRPRGRARASRSRFRHLILAGGGHAHVHVLRMLAARPFESARVTLVSPSALSVYSGMVPGTLVGAYGIEDGSIDVAALAARAGAAFLRDRVVAIDAAAREVRTELSGPLPFDLLSLDVGSRPAQVESVAGQPHVVPVKPVEEAVPRIRAFLDAARAGRMPAEAAVVGGGAGGIEVALGLRASLRDVTGARVVVFEHAPDLMPGGSPKARSLLMRVLRERDVEVRTGVEPRPVPGGLALAGGEEVEAALVIWATGAKGLPLLRESGMPVEGRGFLRVDSHLRSVGAPEIFAAGDCAVLEEHPRLPRAGVFAVRQGSILERNLRAILAGGRLRAYVPQKRFLSLLSTGDRRAVALYGGWAAHGRGWWLLKDWIDRRFIARHAPPRATALRAPEAASSADAGEAATMAPCGGCAAKVDFQTLARMLGEIETTSAPGVAIGLAAPDDAAILAPPGDAHLVFTVDAFPAFLDDPFTVGEVAAVNAVSDVYAMGGTPVAALAIVTATQGESAAGRAELLAAMRGARAGLAREGTALVGGHSLLSETFSIGFAVLGKVAPEAVLTKAGLRVGDRLVLTKPLGTGVICAATRAGECPADWTDGVLASMRASNAAASGIFAAAGVRACTDVSGFGLAGHLAELLSASGCGAELSLSALPALAGARELLAAGWRSSAHAANERALREVAASDETSRDAPSLALACDPQTSGGLLAAASPNVLDRLLAELSEAGIPAAVIGIAVSEPGLHLRA
jgi:selenide,water dikinase